MCRTKEIHSIYNPFLLLCSPQCTVTCGGGVQARAVQCLAEEKPSTGCAVHLKPAVSQACNTNFCPQPEKKGTSALILSKDLPKKKKNFTFFFSSFYTELACQDYFSWCYLVPQHGVCNHKFYGKQCCQSCSNSNL